MAANRHAAAKHMSDRAVSVLIVAVAMVFILGMAGLAVDLASLYVARNQAQRAADAAALAGAKTFVDENCASGLTGNISSTCMSDATKRAEAIGNTNLIGGVSPGIIDSDISFPSQSTTDPQIKVMAGRGTYGISSVTNHGNPMQTFFIKIFGVSTANVSATATAEAYNPSGQSVSTGSVCLKPWLLANCDPNNTAAPLNNNCSPAATAFIQNGEISDPSAIGSTISIKPGNPTDAIGPGKFYPVYLPSLGTTSMSCPSCSNGQTSTGSNSGNLYRSNIECCNMTPASCGPTSVLAISGNMVGPTQQGVECLIHQGNGNSGGQDVYDPTTGTITSGGYYTPAGTQITTSDSIITIPIYDGSPICPGGSNGTTCMNQASITILGFMQVFIKNVDQSTQGTVTAYIMNIVTSPSCSGPGSGSGTGGSGGIIGTGGSAVPIRLIRQ